MLSATERPLITCPFKTRSAMRRVNGGGQVYFPRGLYKITSGLTVTVGTVVLAGSSCGGSKIKISRADLSSNAVTWSGPGTDLIGARDLGFVQDSAITPTSGFVFEFSTAGILGGTFERLYFESVYGCVKSTITSSSINNLWFRDCIGLLIAKYGVWLQYTLNWTFENCMFAMSSNTGGRIPLVVDSSNDGGLHSNCNYLSGNPGVLFQNTQGGGVPSSHMYFRETAADNCRGFGWQINALKRTQFVDCWAATALAAVNIVSTPNGASEAGTTATFTTIDPHLLSVGEAIVVAGVVVGGYNGNWTVASVVNPTRFTATLATSGLAVSGSPLVTPPFATVAPRFNVGVGISGTAANVNGLSFTACIFVADADAVQLSGGADNTQFTGCKFMGYGLRGPANTWSGINIAAAATTSFVITGCMFWHDANSAGFSAGNEWRGVTINSGTYRSYIVAHNLGNGLTGPTVVDGGTTAQKITTPNL